MRDTLRITILALLFLAAGCSGYDRELMGDPEPAPQEPAYADEGVPPETEDSLGVGMFNELEYYGQWHHRDPYGWVWRPSVVTEWQPFVNGHWIWTQYGWMWVDYDPWGWATSHYGYWTYDFALGWLWIPDYTWSPAQCDWLMFDDYICWSPVPPPGTRFKEPWDADKAWVSVPVRRFKERTVGDYREVPKLKSDSPMIHRGAPDIREVERHGPRFSLVEVQLDRRVVGEREFARVKYPADQQRIIDRQTPVHIDNSPVMSPVPAPPMKGTVSTPPTKSKSPATKGNDPPKRETKSYKGKKSEEKKSEEKKSEEKKDDNKKDDSGSNSKKEKKSKQ